MRPDRVSNPGPLTYDSGVLPTALRGSSRYVNLPIKLVKIIFLTYPRISLEIYSSQILLGSYKFTF